MDGQSMIRRGGMLAALLTLGVSTLLGGCSKGNKQLDLAQQEAAELREQNAALNAQLGEKNSRIAELEGRVSQTPAYQPAYERPTRSTPRSGGDYPSGGTTTMTISGDVLFDSGQATIKNTARKELDKVASDIKRSYGGAEIRVEGYTDSDPLVKTKAKWGSNEGLSQARADAVREYLSQKGVGNISSVGMGSAKPKATKAASRRVEIVITR
ncbi:putative lipoprotein YiaD [Phycisphaerales bacterium]|nr:putative lipoprotein YiaD [Phycisphaerales bacterium]